MTEKVKGKLKFINDLTVKEMKIILILTDDIMRHCSQVKHITKNYKFDFIDFKLSENLDALEWNRAENGKEFSSQIMCIIKEVRKVSPYFGLKGKLKLKLERCPEVKIKVTKNSIITEYENTRKVEKILS